MDDSIQLVKVTKDQAEKWLGATVHNRRVSSRQIRFMVREMNEGTWQAEVAPPVFIDKRDGSVIDGQHRLKAFVESDLRVFPTYLGFVARKAIEVIDTGRARGLVDSLTIRGHENAKQKSAWLNRGYQWATGKKVPHFMTRSEAIRVVESAPDLELAAKVAHELTTGGVRRGTVYHVPIGVTAVLYDMQENHGVGGEFVVDFVSRLQTSIGLDDVMSRLQAKLMDASNPRTKLTMNADATSYLIARVFNTWANDEDLAKMYARRASIHDLPGFDEWRRVNFETILREDQL